MYLTTHDCHEEGKDKDNGTSKPRLGIAPRVGDLYSRATSGPGSCRSGAKTGKFLCFAKHFNLIRTTRLTRLKDQCIDYLLDVTGSLVSSPSRSSADLLNPRISHAANTHQNSTEIDSESSEMGPDVSK